MLAKRTGNGHSPSEETQLRNVLSEQRVGSSRQRGKKKRRRKKKKKKSDAGRIRAREERTRERPWPIEYRSVSPKGNRMPRDQEFEAYILAA